MQSNICIAVLIPVDLFIGKHIKKNHDRASDSMYTNKEDRFFDKRLYSRFFI